MADVQPLRALHYDPAVVGALGSVVSPPYDVIDERQHADLAARSPYNVVAIDRPGEDDAAYARAGRLLAEWRAGGAVVTDPQPALWVLTQDYVGPDGRPRTRHGFLARVRVEDYGAGRVRAHERTHPGPLGDRLRLTRATRANLSPIFALYPDPTGAAWGALAPATRKPPWAELSDDDGTVQRLWRVADAGAIAAVQAALRDAELLIADGHHRYETARAYAQEVGGEGPHRYVLVHLVALEDDGLTIFPTHRLVRGTTSATQEALRDAARANFEIAPIELAQLRPPAGDGPLAMGYVDSFLKRGFRLTLRDPAIAERALAAHPPAYRRLDTAILEELLLKRALGLDEEAIAHMDGLGYARSDDEALELVTSGAYDLAFLMRPTPVEQVRAVAAAGVTMPPKSTYFYPKVPTGLVFNELL